MRLRSWILLGLAVAPVPVLGSVPLPPLIIALGDSTTSGTPFYRSPAEAPFDGEGDREAPYTATMMRLQPGWRIRNHGIAGERSDEILARLAKGIWDTHPKVLIVLAGVNDLYQGRPQAHVERQLLAIYREAQRHKAIPVAVSVLPFTAATPEQAAAIRSLNVWIEKTAKEKKIPFCDLNRVAADPKNPDRLKGSPDGLHPDKATYRAMGEALVACLAPHVRP